MSAPNFDDLRPWSELRDSGLLWLINTSVFHPRGYALGMSNEGWVLFGDGSEPWQFGADPTPEQRELYGAKSLDELFALVKTLMP